MGQFLGSETDIMGEKYFMIERERSFCRKAKSLTKEGVGGKVQLVYLEIFYYMPADKGTMTYNSMSRSFHNKFFTTLFGRIIKRPHLPCHDTNNNLISSLQLLPFKMQPKGTTKKSTVQNNIVLSFPFHP